MSASAAEIISTELHFGYSQPRYCYSHDTEEFSAYELFGQVTEVRFTADGCLEEVDITDEIDFAGLTPAELYEAARHEEGTVYSCKVPFYYNGELITDMGPDVYVGMLGDADLDGEITIADAAAVLQYCASAGAGLDVSAADLLPGYAYETDNVFLLHAAANCDREYYEYPEQRYDAPTEAGIDDAQVILRYFCMEMASLSPEWNDISVSSYDGGQFESGILIMSDANLTVDELRASDYRLTLPVTLEDVAGWSAMEFGVMYDPQMVMIDKVTIGDAVKDARIQNDSIVLMQNADNNELGCVWLSIAACSNYGDNYACIEPGVVCYIDFIVHGNVKSGDMIELYMMYESDDGIAQKIYTNDGVSRCQLVSGSIYISGDNITTTPAQTTTTAAATTTVTTPVTSGDFNKDGNVSILDIVMLQKHLIRAETLEKALHPHADLNEDGRINVFDLVLLRQLLIK